MNNYEKIKHAFNILRKIPNLRKLERLIDEILEKDTPESLNAFILSMRTNEGKAIDYARNKGASLYIEGVSRFDIAEAGYSAGYADALQDIESNTLPELLHQCIKMANSYYDEHPRQVINAEEARKIINILIKEKED